MYILDLIFIAVIGTLVGFLIGMSGKPKNKVHFYVARDEDYTLWLYMGKPFRCDDKFRASLSKGGSCLANMGFRFYGLNEDDYADLKWEDEPIEVFLNLEN